MPAEGWPEGFGRRILTQTDSTMAEAARLAPVLAAPAWILAHRQSAGRGRRGRAWVMPPGNFAATLVFRPPGGPAEAAQRSFAAALALHDALTALTRAPEAFRLKWPNDVLLGEGKLAGILLEALPGGALAVGFGVNLAVAPEAGALEAGALPAAALTELTGAPVPPERFLDLLAAAWAPWEDRLAVYGFAPLREAWLARAARLGQRITARTGAEVLTGTFETIDESGRLILATATARRALPAAEVQF